jgi:UDP-glucose-4-epimerase GalE
MKPTILIIGGAGYIGSHTAYLMAQQRYKIIILDKLVHNQPFNHSWAQLIQKDFADQQTLDAIFSQYSIHAVMHFAASIEVGRSVREPLDFYENNVSRTITLLQKMVQHNVKKIIFSSSCAVFGMPQTDTLDESHSKLPISPYGNSKLMIEMALQDAHRAYDLQYVALRYFNAAGLLPGSGLGEYHEPETHIIPLLLRAALHDKPFYVYGNDYPTPDGTCIRDYLHVIDIAQAHAKALDYLDTGNQSDYFNLGTGTGYSVAQLIEIMEQVTGKKIKVIVQSRRKGDPAQLIANPALARERLGWKAEYNSMNDIIRSLIEEDMHGLLKDDFVKNQKEL